MQRVINKPYKTPYSKLSRCLHIIMIVLCVIASIAIFVIDPIEYKLILSILLIAYVKFIFSNSYAQSLVLKFTQRQDISNYLKVHQWKDEQSTPIQQKETKAMNKDKTNSKQDDLTHITIKENKINQDSLFMKSISRLYSPSRSKSRLSESYLSGSRVTSRLQQGQDLSNLSFVSESQSRLMKRSTIASDKNIQILDRKLIARRINQTNKQSQNQSTFEKQLKEINKTIKHVHGKYKIILNYIQRIINPLINQHKSNTLKIKELSLQFLQITIDQSAQLNKQNFTQYLPKNQLPIKIPLNNLIERFIYATMKGISYQNLKFTLKKNKRWNDFYRKIIQLITKRLVLGNNLGIKQSFLTSSLRNNVFQYVEQYNTYMSMIQTYISSDIESKKSFEISLQDQSDQHLSKQFKSRIYILYLFVRTLNTLMNGAIQIDLKDYLGFRQLVSERIDFQITPKHSYDAYVPYFNLFIHQKNSKNNPKQQTCEYGSANYLSIIYLLFFNINKRTNIIKNRPQLIGMINQIL